MSLKRLALKNIRGNWHQYLAYFLSSVLAVTIFFIYASFIFHPLVAEGGIPGGKAVRMGLIAAEYIIIIFAFFFVLYSNSAFIKSRKRELGLYSILGMTKNQMRFLVYLENTLLSFLAIGTGIGLGILFSKLFLMIIGHFLGSILIPFQVVPKALWLTLCGFGILFQVTTIIAILQLRKMEIVELLKAEKQPKPFPLYSRWLAILAFLSLGAGYLLASKMTLFNVAITMFPVLFLVVLGTYFLFTQGSVAILRRLQQRKGIYYQSTNLLTLSNLVFRLKDNARMLFLVAILSAVVISASGYVYILFTNIEAQILDQFPQTIGFVSEGEEPAHFELADVEAILHEDGIELEYELHLELFALETRVRPQHGKLWHEKFLVMSNHDYNQVATAKKLRQLDVGEGEAYYIFPFDSILAWEMVAKGDRVEGQIGNTDVAFTIQEQLNQGLLTFSGGMQSVLVLNDEAYQSYLEQVDGSQLVQVDAYEWPGWKEDIKTIERIKALLPEEEQVSHFENRVEPYLTLSMSRNIVMFVGLFISLLFFIATGSLIYFKLFTELEENQHQYRALYRMGISKQEMRKILKRQVGMIFFIPALVGIMHAAFAYKALEGVMGFTIWEAGSVVMALFLLAQWIYYLLTVSTYSHAVMGESELR